MFGSDVPMQQAAGFFSGVFEDLFGVRAERYFDRCLDRGRGRAGACVNQLPERIRGDVHGGEQMRDERVAFLEQAQQ